MNNKTKNHNFASYGIMRLRRKEQINLARGRFEGSPLFLIKAWWGKLPVPPVRGTPHLADLSKISLEKPAFLIRHKGIEQR